MKKILVTLLAIFLIGNSFETSAQRCLPGQVGLQLTGGIVDGKIESYYTGITLSKYTRNGNKWIYGAEFLNKQTHITPFKIPLSQFTAEGGYQKTILSDRRKTFFLSMGISGLLGYESINNGKKMLSDGSLITDNSSFLYGGAVSLEFETYLSSRVVLLLQIKERYLAGSDVSNWHNQVGFGIKYILK
jgi:hypothetical protein